MRRQSREAVLKYTYSKLFNANDEGLFDVLLNELNEDDKNFARQLLSYVESGWDKYVEIIDRLSQGYQLDRIILIDKCALVMGMAEMDNFENTPLPVIIDETVTITAKYSTERSSAFVNGILSTYNKEKENG